MEQAQLELRQHFDECERHRLAVAALCELQPESADVWKDILASYLEPDPVADKERLLEYFRVHFPPPAPIRWRGRGLIPLRWGKTY